MFSLIIVLVSVGLVAAIAAATMYYLGDSTPEQSVKAKLARVANESAQISGAAVLHRVEAGDYAHNVAELVAASYLSVPPALNWQAGQDIAVLSDVDTQVCTAYNARLGISGVPTCASVTDVGKGVCCSD